MKIRVKTSPVLASPEIGGTTRFMARYVAVRPLDGTQRTAKAEDKRMIPAGRARDAFGAHHAACRQALASLEGVAPSASLDEALNKLEAARKDFLSALENPAHPLGECLETGD